MMECYFSWHSLILAGVFAFNVDITNLLKLHRNTVSHFTIH